MNRITHFSRHALERLGQRSTLSFYELAKLLDCHVFVKIGSEPASNREHRLFYSRKDDSFYVAIQDIHTGAVVTVLPPNYYEKLCISIKENDLKAAKSIAHSPPKQFDDYEKVSPANNPPPSTFLVSAHYNDIQGHQKTKMILRIGATPYRFDIDNLIKDRSFDGDIQRAVVEKGVVADSIWSISIRLGKNGERIYFDWIDNALA